VDENIFESFYLRNGFIPLHLAQNGLMFNNNYILFVEVLLYGVILSRCCCHIL